MSTIIRAKDYINLFSISLRTAQRWMASDKKTLGVEKITARHLQTTYGLDMADIASAIHGV